MNLPKKLKLKTKLQRFIEERLVLDPEKIARLGLWGAGTIAFHNLNITGFITWFGRSSDRIATGLPPPFAFRTRFPWEQKPEPTWEDKFTEWALPAIAAWIMIYHPEAVAKFVDAMIPF